MFILLKNIQARMITRKQVRQIIKRQNKNKQEEEEVDTEIGSQKNQNVDCSEL